MTQQMGRKTTKTEWKEQGFWWSELNLDITRNSCMIFRIVLDCVCDPPKNRLTRDPKLSAPQICPVLLVQF